MPPNELTRDQFVDETERWFQRRGLPYTGTNDVSPFVLVNRVMLLLINIGALVGATLLELYNVLPIARDGLFRSIPIWPGVPNAARDVSRPSVELSAWRSS
jgi:hypothetical protein